MTEQFLHYCWKYSNLPFHQLNLTNGQHFTIVKSGEHNQFESGPDFNNARIKIEEILWCGPIEIHIKSSDWYRHNHHYDRAYDNVILHVVYDNDCTIVQNGREIPTIELRSIIHPELIARYRSVFSSKSTILCKSMLSKVPLLYMSDMITKVSIERLEKKVAYLDTILDQDVHQIFYSLLGKSFGSKVNGGAFEELSYRIPFKVLKQLHSTKKTLALLHVSGLKSSDGLIGEEVCGLERMAGHSWKTKGIRPSSFPINRMIQFSTLINLVDFEQLFRVEDIRELNSYLSQLFSDCNAKFVSNKNKMSSSFQELLIINCFLPFFIWFSRKSNRPFLMESAIELLSLLRPEANHILKDWSAVDVQAENAFESQGLIELHQNYCAMKRCMNCSVGVKLMKE